MVLYENRRIVIAGGGIAGLSTAWAIKQRAPQVDVVVLERGPRPGGNIRTEHMDGYVCESGPDGFLDTAPATMTLVHELGLGSRLLPSNDQARRRYIFRNGRLSEVPTSFGAFLKTPLLSTRGKLRILCEPFAPARRDDDESISGFATRRIGREAAAVFVDPMVSGVYAGDAAALSLKACFPKMRQIEDDHGSLVRGLIATRRTRRRTDTPGAPAGRLTSFTGGMSDLVDGLTRHLGSVVHTSIAVTSVRRNHTPTLSPTRSSGRAYDVTTSQGSLDADAVVLSGPAAESAAIVRELDSTLAASIEGIPTSPLAVVCLGYDEAAIRSECHLDGFGFLVPRGDGIRILGALWETSIYQHRAPAGKALIRVMIGGARDPDAVTLCDAELRRIARNDLKHTMKVSAMPEFVQVIRHARGIPQYVRGHQQRMQRIDALLKAHHGLFLSGNSYRGISINACIADAPGVADAALRAIGATGSVQAGAMTA
ncbi:MAG TPA: protoporphyrinogen oxidase [Vicinamibacterales bacterium]|nr:protoporphyrinogen oxidase [Vicinamibacterales bacterium]